MTEQDRKEQVVQISKIAIAVILSFLERIDLKYLLRRKRVMKPNKRTSYLLFTYTFLNS